MSSKTTQPILTLTLNPALDLTGHLEQMQVGEVNLVRSGHLHPAGKGINVARVLKDLGAKVLVSGFLGQENQAPFHELFHECGFDDHFMVVPGATRINVKMVETSGRVTDLNFPGVEVSESELLRFEHRLQEVLPEIEYVVVAGSLPRGVTPVRLSQWLNLLAEQGKKVLFDSSGAALSEGLTAKPFLIKPNEHELADWVGHPLESLEALMAAAESLQARYGIPHVVVSRGADGVLWRAGNSWWQAKPPRMSVVSTVGAGDSMVAGLAWGLSQYWPMEQILRLASAVSALAVTQIGVGIADPQQLADLMASIEVQQLS
jgi:1-phosphofructokinase